MSFEVLGFDVLLDEKLRPWLLEVNRSPSFATDEKIDNEIKSGLLTDTLRLVHSRSFPVSPRFIGLSPSLNGILMAYSRTGLNHSAL